ncbi:MAG: cysteine desulfurase, partial [Polyangiaceae bacterium]|nr:cysteine desulfurase [Polyangiaceae bacterium]
MSRVYLDSNATTSMSRAVIDAMTSSFGAAWGNPTSIHSEGRLARSVVEGAREKAAAMAGVDARDTVFTSGGTEANNIALRSLFAYGKTKGALVTSRLEHPSITRVAEAIEREGGTVRWVRALESGMIDVDDLAAQTQGLPIALLAFSVVNHETGNLQPIDDIFRIAFERGGIPVHLDAVQAWGKIAPDLSRASTLSFAAHKVRGPKGIGCLFKRSHVRLEPVLLGGAQEKGVRPGTLPAPLCAGLAAAVEELATLRSEMDALAPLRDKLETALFQLGGLRNGSGPRVSHVTNVSFPGRSGPELVAALDLEGISVSSGSACSAGTSEPSPVIRAMVGDDRGSSAVRCSLGPWNTGDEIDKAIGAF